MSKANFKRNPVYITVLTCTWTQDGKEITYDFRHQGDVFAALEACYKVVLGVSYPDFKVSLKETTVI